MKIGEGDFKYFWCISAGFASLTTCILLVTGFDAYVREMKTLRWQEVLGLTYYLFIFPWYIAVVGAIGLKFWPREPEVVIVPGNVRVLHFLNLVFLVPALVAPVLFLPSMMSWAFGPHPGALGWTVMICFYILFQVYLARRCRGFVKWTVAGLFRRTTATAEEAHDRAG